MMHVKFICKAHQCRRFLSCRVCEKLDKHTCRWRTGLPLVCKDDCMGGPQTDTDGPQAQLKAQKQNILTTEQIR